MEMSEAFFDLVVSFGNQLAIEVWGVGRGRKNVKRRIPIAKTTPVITHFFATRGGIAA